MFIQVLVVVAAVQGASGRSAVGPQVRHHLDLAAARFRNLDFPAALNEVAKARRFSERAEDDVQIALYTGIIKAYSGALDDAKTAFRGALALDPTARLPFSVSPKVQQMFDALKANAPPPEPAPAETASAPAPAPEPPAPAPPAQSPPAPEPAPVPAPAAPISPTEKPKLVVLDLTPAGGVEPEVAGALTDAVTTEIAGRGFFDVISAKEVATLLGFERQKQLLGACKTESDCQTQLGGALGARFVLSGSLARLGSACQLSLQVLDTQKGQTIGRTTRIAKALESLRAQIPYAVAEAAGTPLPPPPSRVVPYTLIAGGVALILGGGLAGYDGLSRERVVSTQFQASASRALPNTYAYYQGEATTISIEKNVALAGIVAGAALIATGLYVNPPEVTSAKGFHASLVPSGTGVALVGVLP